MAEILVPADPGPAGRRQVRVHRLCAAPDRRPAGPALPPGPAVHRGRLSHPLGLLPGRRPARATRPAPPLLAPGGGRRLHHLRPADLAPAHRPSQPHRPARLPAPSRSLPRTHRPDRVLPRAGTGLPRGPGAVGPGHPEARGDPLHRRLLRGIVAAQRRPLRREAPGRHPHPHGAPRGDGVDLRLRRLAGTGPRAGRASVHRAAVHSVCHHEQRAGEHRSARAGRPVWRAALELLWGLTRAQ